MITVWDWVVFLTGTGVGALGAVIAYRVSGAQRVRRLTQIDADSQAGEGPPALPPLRPRELQSALCVGDDHLMWRAVLQCIGVLRSEADREAVDVGNHERPPLATFYAGAVAHLDRLEQFMREQRELAKEEADDED